MHSVPIAWNVLLLSIAAVGVYLFLQSVKNALKTRRGESIKTRTGSKYPQTAFWLLAFTGVMLMAATIPSLLGRPMWFVEKIFWLFSLLQPT
jgi:uncharacterized membrane protein SirB2